MSMGDPLSHWPDRTSVANDDGRILFVYSLAESTRSGRPWADGVWRPPHVPVADAVSVSLQRLPGYAVSTSDPDLAEGWTSRGAATLRHAHVMSHDLSSALDAPVVEGLMIHSIGPDQVARHAQRLGALNFAAYPADHPDHEHATVAAATDEMLGVSRGEILGPMLRVSQIAVLGHSVVGAALIVERAGVAPDGGPWVLDIFRDPSLPTRGVGRALLSAVLMAAQAAGLPSVTLVVSHSNVNAVGLYQSMGFVDHGQSWTLALPNVTARSLP